MGKHDITDKEKLFRTQIGQAATVQRETLGLEKASIPNRILCDLGLSLQTVQTHLKNYRYMGSAAVHIYVHDDLGQLDIISQTDPLQLYKCPEDLAAKAFDDLVNAMKQMYGRKRSKLRSGF
jgi:hypothetical protein